MQYGLLDIGAFREVTTLEYPLAYTGNPGLERARILAFEPLAFGHVIYCTHLPEVGLLGAARWTRTMSKIFDISNKTSNETNMSDPTQTLMVH